MKNIKRLFYFILMLMVTLTGMNTVEAVDDYVIFHNEYFTGVQQIPGAGSSYKEVKTSEGVKIAYCFNMKNDTPPEQAKLVKVSDGVLPNEEKTNQYIYILDNGLGGTWNSSIMPGNYTTYQKYYITQVALWIAQGSLNPNTAKNSGNLGLAAYNLYSAAVKNSKVQAYEPKVNLSSNGNLTLSGSNYVSDDITLSVSGAKEATITLVNAPAGSNIVVAGVNKGNQAKLANKTTFKVSIPANLIKSNLTVNVDAKATVTRKKIQIYKYQGSNIYQNIGLIFKEKFTAKDNLKFNINPTGEFSVVKLTLVDNKEVNLSGAVLAVKDSNGNVVAQWNTKDENPKKFSGLKVGSTYTIYEVEAPKGYKKVNEVKITVTPNMKKVVKVMNFKTNPVKISKQDITNKQELPGAHLVLKDSNGKVVDEWVSTDTPHYITDKLAEGTYYLTETIAPKGYKLSTESISFKVNANGEAEKDIVMYNSPKKGVTISKQDIATSKELPGATLVLKDSEGNIVDKWVSTTTPHYIDDLKEGTYTLIETKAPKGYGLSDEVITFEVKYDGTEMKPIVMYNSIIPDTSDINVKYIIGGIALCIGAGVVAFIKMKKHA